MIVHMFSRIGFDGYSAVEVQPCDEINVPLITHSFYTLG